MGNECRKRVNVKRPPKEPDRVYPWLRTRSMPVPMTGKIEHVEVITPVQRRRRWSAEEKAAIVQETHAPGMSVSLVARRHGAAPNQLFTWRRLYASGALSAVGAGEEVVAASEYRALQRQARELLSGSIRSRARCDRACPIASGAGAIAAGRRDCSRRPLPIRPRGSRHPFSTGRTWQ
jgi:transposase-like protein